MAPIVVYQPFVCVLESQLSETPINVAIAKRVVILIVSHLVPRLRGQGTLRLLCFFDVKYGYFDLESPYRTSVIAPLVSQVSQASFIKAIQSFSSNVLPLFTKSRGLTH